MPVERFKRWVAAPIDVLRKCLRDGDGGFAALALTIPWYERYSDAVQHSAPKKLSPPEQLAKDFGIPLVAAAAFWDIFRNGLAHQGMPKQKNQGKPVPHRWTMFDELGVPIELRGDLLLVQPWRFAHRVIDLWLARPALIDANVSFPLGVIGTTTPPQGAPGSPVAPTGAPPGDITATGEPPRS